MPRKSPIHYIYPSAISVTPNANDSENDLAVTVIGGAKIKVYSPKSGISMSGGVYQEWSLTGRNRRLSQSGSPYTIYARLAKSDKSKGYLVFAPKDERDGKWYDKYCYVTPDGIFPQLSASHPEGCRVVDNVNWWVRLGDVSLPEGGKRTVSFDTGILGTDEFNTEWAVSPDSMPMRIEIGCVIDDEDAGPTPYVYWDKMLNLTATLVEGWTGTDIERFDHWEISRNTGDAAADAAWPSAERASLFAHTGRMTLSHERGALDDFNSAVATTFTVTAWGRPDDSQDPDAALVPMKEASIVILAETVEKYEVFLSSSVVSYNPSSDTYRPEDGIAVNVRATDQRGNVYRLGRGQISAAKLVARYAHADTESWSTLQFADSPEGIAEAIIPVAAFAAQKNVNVRLENAAGKELDSRVVSFLRDGEDSREREWIFFRSKEPVVFGDASSEHPLPSLISGGEVEPDGAASGEDTNKNQDGWVPQGWWDEQHGTDDEYRYEYSSYRDYVRSSESEGEGGHWDKFTKPNTWSYYGEDAVSYRCKWLLDGVEVWQLVSSYTGAFRGTLPLVATLMKRKGSGSEEPVAATDTVITVIFEGLDASYTEAASSPQFTISEVDHPEMVSYLNDARLTNILIVFETREETFSYSIPVIKEADEDSIIQTMEEHGSELFLSKTSDDTANGFITFAKGFLSLVDVVIRGAITAAEGVINNIRSSNYTGDGIADTGFRLTSDDGTGSSALTVDNLHVRKKATFEELEVKKETAIAGNQIQSCAKNVINRTDYFDKDGNLLGYSYRQVPWLLKKIPFLLRGTFFGRLRKVRIELSSKDAEKIARIRCYFLAKDDDTEVDNMWRVGDLARCQSINIASTTRSLYIEGLSSVNRNIYWWRKVVAAADTAGYHKVTIDDKEYHYFDVSMTDCDEGSDIPAAGDHVVQFGNDHDPNRMNIMISEVNSADAPAAKDYEGIYTFDLNKNWWQQGQADESPMVYRRSPRAGVKIVSTKFELITRYSVTPVPVERGAWVAGMVYYYYDIVQHKGASWLCVASTGNRYQALEDISAQIPAGTILTQAQYDTLSVEDKIKCTRTATGSTDLEPSEQNIAVWRPYAQKGEAGQSAFKSTVFCRMTNAPAKPTHGSYVSPSPADPAGTDADGEVITWSDGIPDGAKQLWASTRIFSSDGQAPQQSEWNDARKMTDTETYDVEFAMKQTNDAKPAEPNGHNQHGGDQPQVWYDPTLDYTTDFTQMYWRAERTIINGVPGSWVIVRIKGEKGDKGTSIKSVTSFYAKTNRALVMPRDDQEVTWEESLSALGEITEGWYVWTKNITTYSDILENTTTYTVSKWGIDGDGIENIETKFYEDSQLLTQAQLAALTEDKWKEYNQLSLTQGDYIYTRTKITYDKASTPTISYQVNRIGQDGVGYVGTEEYYVLGNSQTNVPSGHPYTGSDPYKKYTAAEWQQIQITGGWSESRPTYRGDDKKYLWNFEVSFDTDGNAMVTKPICIGDYAKGIATIVELYAISAYSVAPQAGGYPSDITTWTDEAHDCAPTDAKPYQWNKTVTTYTDGTSDTFYHVSAVKGTRGRGISNTNIYYKADSSTPATPSGAPAQSGWSDDGNSLITDANAAKHLYESTCTTYSDGTYSWTTPIDDGLISDMAATSEEFALADSGTTAPTTGWRTSVTPTAGKWVWSRTVLTFKNGKKKYVNTQCVGYCGTDGKSITKASADTFRYAIGDSGITPPTSGWSNTKPSSFEKNKWLWTETTIHWSDNSATVLYSAERNPNDGIAGQDIIVDGSTEMKYYVGDSNTTHPAEDSSDWKDLSQVTQTQGKWLWSKATTWYRKASSAAGSKDAGHSVNYNVSYISKDGKTGRGIQSITEYYQATNSSAARQKPTSESGWDTDPNLSHRPSTEQWDANHKYLWNMEKTVYTNVDGSTTTEYSIPQILAIWTKDGDAGRGIDSITNYYKVTSSATAPSKPATPGTDGWSTTPQTPSKGQYLWNYEIITWVNGTPATTETSVQMIGYAGTDGASITKSSETYRYATNNTGTRPAATSSDWKTTKPTLAKGYWLYTETTITWSDGSTTVLYTDERNPNDGVAGQDIVTGATTVTYALTQTNQQPADSAFGPYPSVLTPEWWLWSKATTPYYKANDKQAGHEIGFSSNYSVSYIAKNGDSITKKNEVKEYQVSDNGTTIPTGQWQNEAHKPTPAQNQYLWTRTTITWSDSSTTTLYSAERNPLDGDSVSISSQSVTYSKKAAGNIDPTTITDWGAYPTSLAKGDWLYSKTTVVYSDNKSTTSYAVSYIGNDGTSVVAQYSVNGTSNWHNTYAATDKYMRTSADGGTTWGSAIKIVGEKGENGDYIDSSFAISAHLTANGKPDDTPAANSWSDEPVAITTQKPYLWCQQVRHTFIGETETVGTPKYFRMTGEEGPRGANGRAMMGSSEHYNVSNSKDTQWNVPASGEWANEWTTDPNVPNGQGVSQWGKDNKYLWNYERITYQESNGTTTIARTTPRIIAIWTKDGKGIDSIVNYYAINNSPSVAPTTGWDDDPIAPTADNPYLWNYEVINWTDGTSSGSVSDAHVIGHFGKDGKTPQKGVDYNDGYTPYIYNGYWYINGQNTGVKAEGTNGDTPYIGNNGNWWIGNTDTGIKAQGPSGKDAYTITCEPPSLVINQGEGNTYDISTTNPAYFKPKVTKGTNTDDLVTAVTVTGNYCIKNNRVAIVNAGTWSSTDGLPVTGVNTTAITNKYTQGYLVLRITADSKTFSITIPIAVNYLASYIETIVDGKKTEIARETVTIIKDDGTFVENNDEYKSVKDAAGDYETWSKEDKTSEGSKRWMNEHINTADKNISTITKKVDNGKNLLSGVLTAAGWKSGNYPTFNNDAIVDDGNWIKVVSGDYNIKTPNITLEAGTYTFSLESNSSQSISGLICNASDGSHWGEISLSGSDRKKVTFNTASQITVYIVLAADSIRYPQIEVGSTVTDFDADTIETSSRIKQTADEIKLAVGDTGIDIDKKTINLSGANIIVTTGGTKTAIFENGKVKMDYLDANQIVVNGIRAKEIDAGNAKFSNVTVNGVINASSGSITGPMSITGVLTVGNTNGRHMIISPSVENNEAGIRMSNSTKDLAILSFGQEDTQYWFPHFIMKHPNVKNTSTLTFNGLVCSLDNGDTSASFGGRGVGLQTVYGNKTIRFEMSLAANGAILLRASNLTDATSAWPTSADYPGYVYERNGYLMVSK